MSPILTVEQAIARILGLALHSDDYLGTVLQKLVDEGGDLAPVAGLLLQRASDVLANVNPVEFAAAVAPELVNIIQLKFEPKDHPSDLA